MTRFTTVPWRVISGVGGGLAFAAVFSAFAVVATLADGPAALQEKYGLTLETLIAGYAGGGAIGGLLHPLRYNRYGAMVVTAVAILPFYAGIVYLLQGNPTKWPRVFWFSLVLVCIVFGVIGGRLLRIDEPASGDNDRVG